jgi:ubiquinone/menaquinone biosynthesis C-methylase UbiE
VRDVESFDRRADSYERGRLGEWHLLITERVTDMALADVPAPHRVLDVGCGTGALLRLLAARVPGDVELVGVDPAPRMLAEARKRLGGMRLEHAAAERLPFADATFDLVVSAMSFDHWADQALGLAECARVLHLGGNLVLADLFAAWLLPPRRNPRRVSALLTRAGFREPTWRRVYNLGPLALVQAALATR